MDKKIKNNEKKKQPYISDIDDPNLDAFKKENRFLKTGHRIFFHTYPDCVRSMFMLHNETINIWSHFIGVLIFLFMIFYVLIALEPTSLND